jgi:hypothetical protein
MRHGCLMPKRSSRGEDTNQIAARVVALSTGQPSPKGVRRKNPAAVALGKLGGSKGGKARAKSLSPERRSEIASDAARKRWQSEKE